MKIAIQYKALPEETCLETQFFANGEPVDWWPTDTCVRVEEGTWQIAVPLGEGDAPDELDPAA